MKSKGESRKIKLRWKDPHFGWYFWEPGKDPLLWLTHNGETLGQWTGLKDKNGTEIYEGDVVKSVAIRGRGCYGVVKFVPQKATFMLVTRKEGQVWIHEDYENEVRGNVFDDPEMKDLYWEIFQQ